jgi:hypothetical protein
MRKAGSEIRKSEKGDIIMNMKTSECGENEIWDVVDRYLGSMPDEEIVSWLGLDGVTAEDVERRRAERNIPRCLTMEERALRRKKAEELLGTMPDARIAKALGYSRQFVSQLRTKKKIPVYKTPEGLKKPGGRNMPGTRKKPARTPKTQN